MWLLNAQFSTSYLFPKLTFPGALYSILSVNSPPCHTAACLGAADFYAGLNGMVFPCSNLVSFGHLLGFTACQSGVYL